MHESTLVRSRLCAATAAAALTLSLVSTLPGHTAAAETVAPAPVTVTGLTTNGRTDPLGIPGAAPSLGWHEESTARGVVQSAYQVRVASSADALASADVWDSGKVPSDKQVDIAYAGPALTSETRYVWQVRTWDGAGTPSDWSEPATFETGLLNASDWGGAEWVGAPSDTELSRWTDYTADFDFTLDNLVFAPYIRAADLNNGLMWQLSVADGTPRFRPHLKVNGGYTLLDNKDISSFISVAQLKTGTHRMSVKVDGPTITTSLDGTVIDTRTVSNFTRGYVGFRSDNATEGAEASTVHDVTVTRKDGTVLLDTDFSAGNPFDGGTLVAGGLQVKGKQDILWHSPDANLPLLRTEFGTTAGKTVSRARVYATARGVYELRLNGQEVGDEHLAPGWTDYDDTIQHQTYDVTDLVEAGQNAFGAEIGSGWYAGRIAHLSTGNYGTQTSLMARLRIDYTDGTTQWVDTDHSTWTAATGPWAQADNIDGETYDARLAKPGWDTTDYDASGWAATLARTSATSKVVPQPDEPVRTTDHLATVKRTEPTSGTFIYDLGQNMVGVASLRLTGTAGSTVTMRYGEELNPDGTLYTANLRSAKVTDRYTFAADGTVTYTPTFTQHGFRYVEVTGASVAPAASDVTGVVWGSDLAATGDLSTSDAMLNQLASNISWGQRDNFLSIPTDTPARDERLGWSGDINVFAPTASYLRDTRAFLNKWMGDMRDTQDANGDYQGVAPTPPNFKAGTGTGWSDAGITVPYTLWHSYGDATTAREYWADMTKFFGLLTTSAGADLLETGRNTWGDWLNLDDPTPGGVLGTAYFAEDARMMSEMAAALGEDEQAAEYADLSTRARAAFAQAYIAADGTVSGNSQTAYAMALGMNLVPESMKAKVGAKFVAKLALSDNHLTTGFLGTPWLLPALSTIGRDDLAYTMLLQKDYPSWGYEVEKGATTMWERWNSIMPDGSFGDVSMNSFNHYAYGAVGDWMYQHIGAISALEPGYKKIRVAPSVGGGLTHGAGTYDSVYGTIATDWTLTGDDLSLSVDVPANTTAEVVLPAADAWAVTEGGKLLDEVDGVTAVSSAGGNVTVTVGSGSYEFAVTASAVAPGRILDQAQAVRDHAAEVADAGDLTPADAAHVDGALGTVVDDARAAVEAAVGGSPATVTSKLASARAEVASLRTWLAGSSAGTAVKSDLDTRLAALEQAIGQATATSLGVTVTLPPVAGAALPGTTVSGTVEVSNAGQQAVTALSGTVTVDGWEPADVSAASVPAGGSAQLPVTLTVPDHAAPASYDAALHLTLTLGGETYTFDETTPAWASVTSGLTLGDVTASLGTGDPAEHATLKVPVTNTGTRTVRARVVAELPAGWKSVPSAEVVVPAGQTVTATVPVVVPIERVGDAPTAVTVSVRRAADVLVSKDASVSLPVVAPPTATTTDTIDWGVGTSETAHSVLGSDSSGISSEAGLTRRYSHSAYPGSWFSATFDVPAGKPFILRNRETFGAAGDKQYNVYVDDVLAATQSDSRTSGGVNTYDLVIDDPAVVAANDGNVRIKFEFPDGSPGDPSLADTWVLPVPADTQAPDASAWVSSGTPGEAGWYRSDVHVSVSAADNRDGAPSVETGDGSGWQAYTGPVTFTGDGKHELSYRAHDAAGNSSGPLTLPVWIDTAAPTTTLAVTRGAGVEGSDRATLAFTATDALSGVGSTVYRIDGGDWTTLGSSPATVQGYGEHTVDYASTDVAGNAEAVQHTAVTLADVDTVSAIVAPTVRGAARVGSTLTSTTGSWNTKGLTLTRQWLRNGSAVRGATGPTYRVGVADIGRRISLRVTATKDGKAPGVATSAATAAVAKVTSTSRVALSKAKVKRGKKVTVTATVTAPGLRPTGRVQVVVDGHVVSTRTLAGGRASVAVKVKRGKHRVSVRYLGSTTVAPSSSAARVVTGR